MTDTADLSRAGRDQLLRIIAEQQEEIRRLLAPELAVRDARITELQARMTEMVDSSLPRRVRAFHLKFGHPVAWTPKVPDDEQVRFRLNLITEEFFELLRAGLADHLVPGSWNDKDETFLAHRMVSNAIKIFSADRHLVDLPEFVDALADLDYVIEGTRAAFGVNGGPIMDEVQRANMSKDPAYVRNKDGWIKGETLDDVQLDPKAKPTKPEGWEPPNIERALREQGWDGK